MLQIHIASAQTPRLRPKTNADGLDTTMVNLRGQTVTTIIINHTADTLKLNATISHYLPVGEQSVAVVVAPGERKAFNLTFYYPDFIRLDAFPFSIYNAPGKTVECSIENTKTGSVIFTGDLKDENAYYQAYHKAERSNQWYYQAGTNLRNFNNFPHLADSITHINLNFLLAYQGALSQHFKQQEQQRLNYNNAFLKYHVLFDRSAKAAQPVAVNQAYYDFEKTTSLAGKNVMLSTEYLWYAVFYLRRQALLKNPDETQLTANMLREAESAYPNQELGDVLKMRLLYDVYRHSAGQYRGYLTTTRFVNPVNRLITDSVATARLGFPKVGKPAPKFKLLSSTGDSVSLQDFAGRPVILNFWAPWCAPCVEEFPAENRLAEKYSRPGGLVVINVCVDATLPGWQHLSAAHGLKMINLYADAATSAKLKQQYDLSALPKSVAIGKNLTVTNNYLKRASQLTDEDVRQLMSW
ncbi:TlpA disulfide reductase family protein [Mucilaginibacter sp. CSA2-8R]|uniref:TlpA family protein disulfide reductase n=1 Tax=Mucilaginibacter sp. CSA2-8R TaxID=3141542 RepID=UPI00315CBE46